MYKHFFTLILLLSFLLSSINTMAQSIIPWLTTGSKSSLLQPQAALTFSPSASNGNVTISIDSTTTYQTMDGFGFCLTEGSAEVISTLTTDKQDALLTELFDPNSGLGISVLRISIGASDLSSADYTYDDGAVDLSLANFSLNGLDKIYLIPILKKILLINPDIKILATPWTAPRWMKSTQAWIGGTLNTAHYAAYANYFVKYFDAMKAEGIDIWAITPQNEPLHQGNDPSMGMSSTEQINYINSYLGPTMKNAGYSGIKIIAYDHNCDNTAYPIDVCNNSTYVDGSAFHLYAGNISALTTVKNATNKNVYFTEQYTGVGGSFSGDLGWHLQNVVTGAANNWAKAIVEWNLAGNANAGPHTASGCSTCLGAITINNSTTFTRNVSYYIIGQISKFVKPGAVRIYSLSSSSSVSISAFKNSDGSTSLLAYNSSSSAQILKVTSTGQAFNYTIPPLSAATFVWNRMPSAINKTAKEELKIYTNSAEQTLIVKSGLKYEHLTIYSMNGETLIKQTNVNQSGTNTIDIQRLSKGIYFLKIDGDEYCRTLKFFKY
ncbi:MAG: glycoside hydrolase family 30 beta sandwich domain-containing protein [Bacteroidales bacterium]